MAASFGPRTWSSSRNGGTGALRKSVLMPRSLAGGVGGGSSADGRGREPVEDEADAGEVAGRIGQVAPTHPPVRADDHDRPVRHPAGLEVGAERACRRALGLEVRELLDRDAELLLERLLRPDRIGRDAVERRALGGEVVEGLLVDLQLIGADRAEGKGVEDQDRRLAEQVLAREVAAVLALERELRGRCARSDDAHRRSPSSLMSSRYPSRSELRK